MLKLNDILTSHDGKRLTYLYSVDKKYGRYFEKESSLYLEYDVDVSSVPYSIAVIPFLANVMPIAWFLGCDVQVDEVDGAFLACLSEIKGVLGADWSDKRLAGEVKAERVRDNKIAGERYAMLYSGGVDAVATHLRHCAKNLDLITVLGADIPIDDVQQWEHLLRFIDSDLNLTHHRKYRLASNLREFYTYRVDLLVDMGWWGKVQHGLALLGIIAPLSFVNGYRGIYLASSQADGFAWGSHPKTDNRVRWADLFCANDGFELGRQDKIQLIIDKNPASRSRRLHVCYSELNKGLNCSRCEKCYRTMLGILLAGGDPNQFGFSAGGDFYQELFEQMKSLRSVGMGLVNLWKGLAARAKENDGFFVLEDREKESAYLAKIASGELTDILAAKLNKGSSRELYRYKMRNRFKKLYRAYRYVSGKFRSLR